MSALYRLKAYFGMVPAEELDDFAHVDDAHDGYAAEYDRDYDRDYDREYARGRGGRQSGRQRRPEPLTTRAGARWADSAAGRADDDADHYPDAYQDNGHQDGRHQDGRHQDNRRRDAGRRHDYYDDHEPAQPPSRERSARRNWVADAPPVRGSLAVDPQHEARMQQRSRPAPVEEPHPFARITTLHPRTYNEARTIGEHYRDGIPVIMNLTEMADPDAKRLVDFAAGLAFALRGSIDKVTTKVFLISPPNVDVTAEDKRRIAEGNLPRQ